MRAILQRRGQQEEARARLAQQQMEYGATPEEQAEFRKARIRKLLADALQAEKMAAYYESGGAAGAKNAPFAEFFKRAAEKGKGGAAGATVPQAPKPTHAQTMKKVKPKAQDITLPSGEVIKASEQPVQPMDPAQGFNYIRERGVGNTVGDLFDALAEWMERQQSVRPPEFGFPQSESDIMFGMGPREKRVQPRAAGRGGLGGPWNLR